MYLSCSTLCFSLNVYPDIREVLEEIRCLRFPAVDLAVFEGWQNVDPSALADGDDAWVEDFLKGLAETGLAVSSFNCGFSRQLDDPAADAFAPIRREFETVLALAGQVDCPNLTVQPGRPIEGYAYASLFHTAQMRLAELGALAQAQGVTLSVEGHQGSLLENPADAVRMVEALWPTVGFTYDPSHWTMQAIPLPETAPLLPMTYHVHVRDAALDAMQAPMDEGEVDVAWLVAALREHNYEGAVAIEYFNGFDADLASTRALRDRLVALGVRT